MTISATSLYDYCNKNSQAYFKRASEIQRRKPLTEREAQLAKDLFKEANLLMNTVMEIEMRLKDDKPFLPAISFKNGVIKIGGYEERTVWLKVFLDLSHYDLRRTDHKLQAIRDIANHLSKNRHIAVRGGASEQDIDLIFQLSCLHSDNLKPLLN